MKIEDLVDRFDVALQTAFAPGKGEVPTGKLWVRRKPDDESLEKIKALKPEIIAYLTARKDAEEQARKERQAKIDAIPGLTEIEAARDDLESWYQEFSDSFEDEGGGGVGVRPKPKHDLHALCVKYPKAAAYLKARAYADAENYAKSGAGEAAIEAIINGEDYTEAIDRMEKTWKDYCRDHIWD